MHTWRRWLTRKRPTAPSGSRATVTAVGGRLIALWGTPAGGGRQGTNVTLCRQCGHARCNSARRALAVSQARMRHDVLRSGGRQGRGALWLGPSEGHWTHCSSSVGASRASVFGRGWGWGASDVGGDWGASRPSHALRGGAILLVGGEVGRDLGWANAEFVAAETKWAKHAWQRPCIAHGLEQSKVMQPGVGRQGRGRVALG